jgi:hypothetical protein
LKRLIYSSLFAVFGLTLWFISSIYKWEIYYYKNRMLHGNTVSINNNEIKLPFGYALLSDQENRKYHMLYSLALGNNFRLVIEEGSKAKYPIEEYEIVFKAIGSQTDSCRQYQANVVNKEVPAYLIINDELGVYINIYRTASQSSNSANLGKICSDLSGVPTT